MLEYKNILNVRWNDGYLETFECSEVRFGSDLLWARLASGGNRHIPLRQVRWFSQNPESHEKLNKAQTDKELCVNCEGFQKRFPDAKHCASCGRLFTTKL